MKQIVLSIASMLVATLAMAQPDFHAGQTLSQVEPDYKDINYAADDLEAHRLDIYLPKDNAPKHKVIIAIYGSAWFSNNMKGITYFSYGKPLTEAGFAVVCINHRSSTDAKFPAQINDVKGAIRFIRANAEKYNLDTSFIGITGFSSGGHLSALAGVTNGMKTRTVGNTTVDIEGSVGGNLDRSSSVDAVVDWFGPVDMARMENCSEPKDDKSPEAVLIGGDPRQMTDMVQIISPVSYVAQAEKLPPFMVIHGDADDVVPYCQSQFLSDELQKRGVLEKFITVSDGKHGPITFNEETFKAMANFFVKEANK